LYARLSMLSRTCKMWDDAEAVPAKVEQRVAEGSKRSAPDGSSDRTVGCVRAGECVVSESWAPRDVQ